jgi:hypothetical protein
MAFGRVRFSDLVTAQIRAWALPDQVQLELFFYLTRVLPADPEHNLIRVKTPFDGMSAECLRRDPHVKGRDYQLLFRVFIGQDEESLFIERGYYEPEQVE